jgi:hypothetical protein
VYGSPDNISTMLLLLSVGACGLVVGISLALEAIQKGKKGGEPDVDAPTLKKGTNRM